MVFCRRCKSLIRSRVCACGLFATNEQLEELNIFLGKKIDHDEKDIELLVSSNPNSGPTSIPIRGVEESDEIEVPEGSILQSKPLTEAEKEINNFTRYFISRWEMMHDNNKTDFEEIVTGVRNYLKEGNSVLDLANMTPYQISQKALRSGLRGKAYCVKGIALSYVKKYEYGEGLKEDKQMTIKDIKDYAEYIYKQVKHVFNCDKKPIIQYLKEGYNFLNILAMSLKEIERLVRVGATTAQEVYEKTIDYIVHGQYHAQKTKIDEDDNIIVPATKILSSKKPVNIKPKRVIKRTSH